MELGIILFLAGVLVGALIQGFRTGAAIIGTLVMVRQDPSEPPCLYVELDKPLENIKWKRLAIMRVSQK